MAASTPPEIEAVLEQMRQALLRWHTEATLGEIAVVVGEHQYQPEERPRRKGKAVKREPDGGKVIVRVDG